MKKVIIDRSKWLNLHTRHKLGPSVMLDVSGNRCCLGFIAQVEGIEDDKLLALGTPAGTNLVIKNLSTIENGNKFITNTPTAGSAMELNDQAGMSTAGRERALQILFADLYELEFVGEYPQ